MQLRCVNCDKTLEIPDQAAGKKVRCPACMTTMIAPQTGNPAAPAPASGSPPNPASGSTFSSATGVPHPEQDRSLPFATAAAEGSRSKVHCPNCDRALALTAEVAGQIVSCPECRRRMKMPLEVPSSSRSPAPPASGPAPTQSAYPAAGSQPPAQPAANPYVAANPYAGGNPYTAGNPPLGSPGNAAGSPYQTPIGGTGMMSGGHSEPVVYVLPGVFLAVIAGVSVLVSAAQVLFGVLGGGMQAPDVIMAAVFFGLPLLVNLLIVVGGIQMARRQSLTLCRIAAGLAIMPFFGFCCVGNMPFGIWAMIVLLQDNANRDFH